MSNDLTRRSFVKWGTATAGAATLAGLTACAPSGEAQLSETGDANTAAGLEAGDGEWRIAPCPYNCSCGAGRCLLRAYVVDGVPQFLRTDEEGEDSIDVPQRRACPRGRAQISNILSADRVKYPMKRKGWSPDNPNGQMRGKDEWERISWDEAMDILASETKKIIDKYGVKGIFTVCYDLQGICHYTDANLYVLNSLGGFINNKWGTVSLGSWPLPEMYMTGSTYNAPDANGLRDSQLQVHFGCNWMSNKGGNWAYYMQLARDKGSKIIIVDPWLNQTAEGVADEWIPVRPGTDTALVLGMMHHMIENNLQNQDFLDTYCVGFDAAHMPEGAPAEDNFRDYVLGTYDNEPKAPEWAAAICGVPAATIRALAEEIAGTERVALFAAQSSTKIPAGEMFAQAFYTLAFMHGMGTPGNYASWSGLSSGYVAPGDWINAAANPENPIYPAKITGNTPDFDATENWDTWDWMEYSEVWESILAGEYGRDVWPGGKRKVDFHMIACFGGENGLNSNPNANKGIEVFRKMDFVVAGNPWFCATAQYADLVLPYASMWEKSPKAWSGNGETLYWSDIVIDPLYEAKTEFEVARMFAERMGIDPDAVDTASEQQRTYQSVAGAFFVDAQTMEPKPLISLTDEDISSIGYADGKPQDGLISFSEFKEKGLYKVQRKDGDALTTCPWSAFVEDPDANPLATESGKFEIYCRTLERKVNAFGFSTIYPIAKWQIGDPNQGQGTQTEEYPLLLWTPHSLRRAHTVNDSVVSLREAFPQECFMSTVDAEELGIKTGDLVLMTSPYGQVLRPAKVMTTVVPGAVALQDGAWMNIDPDTGIDLGGCPNILQAPAASGQGSQSYTGTLVRVEKYTGDIELLPDKNRPLVLPVGVEE